MNFAMLKHFGLGRMPFPASLPETPFDSADNRRVREGIAWAVAERGAVAVIGDIGYGKTSSVADAVYGIGREGPLRLVDVLAPDRRHMMYSSIEVALMTTLAPDQHDPRNGERRAILIRQILGMAYRDRVLIVIEEAQALNVHALRGLKRLREMRWTNHCPLAGLVLVGHPRLKGRLDQYSEIGLRIETVEMQGLEPGEAAAYLRHCLALAGNPDAIEAQALELLGRRYRAPLSLNRLASETLEATYLAGRRQAGVEDAAKALGFKVARAKSGAATVKADDVARMIEQQTARRAATAQG